MIDHGGGIVTLYGHCSRILTSAGRPVKADDIIALSGSTGRSTGRHLHFEVRVSGKAVNPRGFLP
ncbi:M23 family metallopeptidase [Caproicibacter fermentans]|uniref:M23 family metallopeptidase n=1 Tax=Caproicibacter fermentans TaxID=2576756 RepID=UPI0039B8A1A1